MAELRHTGSNGILNYGPLHLARAATTRSYDFDHFRKRIPHMRTIFRLAPHAEAKRAEIMEKLSEQDRFIFSLINGTRNIRQIARFSGAADSEAVEALYRLHTAGIIRQSLEIIEYEDRQFNEISNLLDTRLELYADLARNLIAELGSKAQNIIGHSKADLAKTYIGMFADIPWDTPDHVARDLILRNIAQFCPDPGHKGIFIEAFCDLLRSLQQAGSICLGSPFATRVTTKIGQELKNVMRYAKESALRSHLIETFDKLINPPRRTDAQYHP